MKEKGHTYTPCAIGEWNLITLQFNGNEGIYSFTCVAESISNLQQSIQPYMTMLKGVDVKGDILFRPIVTLSLLKHRGKLLLGSGFTGDIAWIHGFRDIFTESSLMDEIHRVVRKPIHTIKTNTDTSKSFFSRLKW
jgi:hypothetical protein